MKRKAVVSNAEVGSASEGSGRGSAEKHAVPVAERTISE